MRMLYSSSKANVSDIINSQGGRIDAKVEVNVADEIDLEEITETLHPKKEEKLKGFSRPKKPGKGGARLIRDTQQQN